MKKMLEGCGLERMIGMSIKDIKNYHGDLMPGAKPYNPYLMTMTNGREFIVWNSWGETNCSEVISK